MPKPNLDAPVNNTPYSEEDLEYFRELLIKQREETITEIDQLKESVEDLRTREDDESSAREHHPGNVGTEEGEEETLYVLIERSRNRLQKINAALDRIDLGTYGVCQDTGKQIQRERLEAIPYTRYSVEAKRKDDASNPGPIGGPAKT
jgi:RNA polymerase-binding protein DksA